MQTVRVASRRSQLAMTQTQWVIEELKTRRPDWQFEIVPVVTKGDRILDVTLSKVGGKGLFVSEIEQTLQVGTADMAVHSLKDVPYELATGLHIGGIPLRADPRDALISQSGLKLSELPYGARVGTSSLRRSAQLLSVRPDLQIEPLRGNIDTRLRRAENGDFDAIVLAAAGLQRMGWASRITEYLAVTDCLPAVGQGVLAVECRERDDWLGAALAELTDADTRRCATAERALLETLQGSCQVPIAGYAEVLADGSLQLTGLVADPASANSVRYQARGDDAGALGRAVAERLLAMGADIYLTAARGETD